MDPWNLSEQIVSRVVAAADGEAAEAASQAAQAAEAASQAAQASAGGGISLLPIAAAVSMAATIFAAAYAIKGIATSAIEGATRQPDVQAKLQTQMIVAIAFIEGLSIISLIFGGLLLHN